MISSGALTAMIAASTPATNVSNVPPWLGGMMVWWILTVGVKAVGQRVKPGNLSDNVFDKILDGLTLLFAIQVALSAAQAPLVSSVVTIIKTLAEKVAGGTGVAGGVAGTVIGIIFAVLAVLQGLKFSKEDEKSSAWRPLALFGLFALITFQNVPFVSTWVGWTGVHITVPAANGIMAGINYLASLHF